MENVKILEMMEQSDMILVGLGEDFDNLGALQQSQKYVDGCNVLKKTELHWLIPAWNEYCVEKAKKDQVDRALEKIAALLGDKNYFVVSVSTNSSIDSIPWKKAILSEHGRCVMPCGSILKKQCINGCDGVLQEVTEEDRGELRGVLDRLSEGRLRKEEAFCLGVCPKCGAPFTLNNIYVDNYNENGYMERWKLYTKWLQGTLNKRLLLLELGVNMWFPSVIRWPFEKAAFFNEKAYFCRVNQRLYQLSAELAGKGCGISQNAIDWLSKL